MQSTPTWDALDTAYRARLERTDSSRRWLLTQTLAMAPSRRTLLGSLAREHGVRLIDVGCGFGASLLEWATLRSVSATGVDLDPAALSIASEVACEVGDRGGLAPGSTAAFARGDIYDLPITSGHADVSIVQFVFQHLSNPATAAEELARVLRPGGLACVIDADDGLSISEPPASDAYMRLAAALNAAQAADGGDRRIGRKLAGILDRAGFDPLTVLVIPQGAYFRPVPGDPGRQLVAERFRVGRQAIIDSGQMTADEFDSTLAAFVGESPGAVCEIEGYLAVIARRR
jgi:SAM-dependent methyltransferase